MLGSTCFLLLLPGLVASWATSQCESDQVAHVQKDLKAVKVGALEQEVSGRICSISDLNSGDCVGTSANPKCTDCNPTGQVIPTTGTGFPPGSLSCGEGSCRFEDDAPSNAFYEFRRSRFFATTCQGVTPTVLRAEPIPSQAAWRISTSRLQETTAFKR